jgi:hypothetical protein
MFLKIWCDEKFYKKILELLKELNTPKEKKSRSSVWWPPYRAIHPALLQPCVCPCAVCSGRARMLGLGNDAASRRGATTATATALVRSGSGQSKPTQPPCVRACAAHACLFVFWPCTPHRPHVGARSTARQLRRVFFPLYKLGAWCGDSGILILIWKTKHESN